MDTGLDYYKLDDQLTDEQKIARSTARQFTQNEVLPIIQEYHRKAIFPVQIISKMGELGFLGSTLPQEYGCPGLDNFAYGLVMQELERGDSSIRSFASVQSALGMHPIYTCTN